MSPDLFVAGNPGSTAHLMRVCGGRGGWVVTFCSGRAMQFVLPAETVTCKSCLKRAAKEGVELAEAT